MKLRLGQDVHTSDGPFGELGDIIVDPIARTVTHLVVEPHHRHHQARLIPMHLVHEGETALTLDMDADHVRHLAPVSYSDYVKFGETIDVGDDWDIGTEEVFLSPYHDLDFEMGWFDSVGVTFDRIPKGDCEIRRTSRVNTTDGKTVGTVHGLIADRQHIKAVIVRSGRPGFRHDVLVPLGSVKAVRTDEVDLVLAEDQFALLPRTEILAHSDDLRTHVIDLRHRAESVGGRAASTGRSLVASARSRFSDR